MSMLVGSVVALRPVRESDLDAMWEAHTDLAARGEFFPLGVISESAFRRAHAQTGMWEVDEGTLLLTVEDDVVGHIEFFRPMSYWDAYELSYQLYDQAYAGHGYVTEAVRLLVDYLFDTRQRHRIQLVIAPGNAASRRIAEKCGFSREGTCRGAFFHRGINQDVFMYSLLRSDPRRRARP